MIRLIRRFRRLASTNYNRAAELVELFNDRKNLISEGKIPYLDGFLCGQGFMLKPLQGMNLDTAKRPFVNLVEICASKYNKDNITVIDVGANIGQTSIIFASLEKVNKVLAYEPFPDSLKYLRKNVQSNHYEKIDVLPYGLFSESKKISMGFPKRISMLKYFDRYELGMKTVYHSRSSSEIMCDFKKGDECGELMNANPDIIKIDVEGSEIDVLIGLSNIIREFMPFLLIECNSNTLKNANKSIKNIFSIVKEYGYSSAYPFSSSLDYSVSKDSLIRIENIILKKISEDFVFIP